MWRAKGTAPVLNRSTSGTPCNDDEPDEIPLSHKKSNPAKINALLRSDDDSENEGELSSLDSVARRPAQELDYDSDDLVMRHPPFSSGTESEDEPDYIDLDDDAGLEPVLVDTEEVKLDLTRTSIPVQFDQEANEGKSQETRMIRQFEENPQEEEEIVQLELQEEFMDEQSFQFGGQIPEGAYLGFTTADGEKMEVEPGPKHLAFYANSPIKCPDRTSSVSKNDMANEEFVYGGEIPEGAYLGFTTADGEKIGTDSCPKYLDIFADSPEDNDVLLSVAEKSSQIQRKARQQKKPFTTGFTAANGEDLYTLTEEELKKAREWTRKQEMKAPKSINYLFEEEPYEDDGIYTKEFVERLMVNERRKKQYNKIKESLQMHSPGMFNGPATPVPSSHPLTFTQEISSAVAALMQDTQFLMPTVAEDNYWTVRDVILNEKRRQHQSMINKFRRSMLRSKLTDPVKRQRLELIERLRLAGGADKPAELRRPFKSEFIQNKSEPGRVQLKVAFTSRNPIVTLELDLNYEALVDYQFNAMAFLPNGIIIDNFREGIPVGHFLVPMTETFAVGPRELEIAFLAAKGIDPQLISPQWFANAYKLILWKLVSMELLLPEERKDEILTVDNVLNELHYRYYMEIDLVKRSSLRECLEMDAVPGQLMVLVVEDVRDNGGLVILCDGQYSVKARIDAFLQRQIERGLLRRGIKLIVDSAEFINLDRGYAPLEVPESVLLQIHGNSTRRCRWDTKLGRFNKKSKLKVSLQSVDPLGGVVSAMDLLVVRRYPLLFVSQDRHRNERMQRIYMQELETENSNLRERLYNTINQELAAEEQEMGKVKEFPCFTSLSEIEAIQDLHEILQTKKNAHLKEQLTEIQREELAKYRERLLNDRMELIQQRINKEITEEMGSHSVLLRVKVTDLHSPSLEKCAELWIWNPMNLNDMDLDIVDGAAIYVENVVATGTRFNMLQLKSGKAFYCTKLAPRKCNSADEPIHRKLTKLSSISDISTFVPVFLEFDVVVIVLLVSDRLSDKFLHVFATDDQLNVICLSFWKGLEEFCCQDIVVPGQVIALSNLQWRSKANSYRIPNGYVTEVTVLTRSPRDTEMIQEVERLQEFLNGNPLEKLKEDVAMKHPFLKNINSDLGSLSRIIQSPDIQAPLQQLAMRPPLIERQVNQLEVDPQPDPTVFKSPAAPISSGAGNKRKWSLK